ncbi:MAG: chemotaxis protein CheW [Myxococcales bacterium]
MADAAEADLLHELRELETRLADLRARITQGIAREAVPTGDCPLLVCRIGTERVAVFQSQVEEVVLMARLTPLPEAPPWIAGLLNLRGRSLVVVDALARLTRSARRPVLSDRIVICALAGRSVGLVVQEVVAVETVAGSTLQSPSPDTELAPYLLGVFHREDAAVLLVSVSALVETSGLPATGT